MHFSPQVALLEACCGCTLFLFFLWHCWRYDRWACFAFWRLATETPRDPWKLKRVLAVFYLIRIPVFVFKAVAVMSIKYKAGFTEVASEGRGMPVQYTEWTERERGWINPLNGLDAFIWFSDLCTNLEELCFWLFLIHCGPRSTHWFGSFWFKLFLGGSLAYAALLTGTTAAYIDSPLYVEAVTFMGFSTGVLVQCMVFAYVLYAFPKIIKKLMHVGGSPDLLHRLLSFHELNKMQLALRLIFGLSMFVLSLDGLGAFDSLASRPKPINTSLPALDAILFLTVLSNMGGCIITILVFLPRSPLEEHGVRDRRVANKWGGAILEDRRTSTMTVVGDELFAWEYDAGKDGLRDGRPESVGSFSEKRSPMDEPPRPPVPAYPLEHAEMPAQAPNSRMSALSTVPSVSEAPSPTKSDYAPSLPDLPPKGALSRLTVPWSRSASRTSAASSKRVEALPVVPQSDDAFEFTIVPLRTPLEYNRRDSSASSATATSFSNQPTKLAIPKDTRTSSESDSASLRARRATPGRESAGIEKLPPWAVDLEEEYAARPGPPRNGSFGSGGGREQQR